MIEFLIALLFLLLVMAAMAVGVMMGRPPLKGSCGGVGAALGDPNYTCDICGGDPAKCDEQSPDAAAAKAKSALGYNADRRG